MADSKKYREEADRLRMESSWIKDPDHKRMVLKLAKMYDRLAEHTEKLHGTLEKP
jgi:hypothetical protein